MLEGSLKRVFVEEVAFVLVVCSDMVCFLCTNWSSLIKPNNFKDQVVHTFKCLLGRRWGCSDSQSMHVDLASRLTMSETANSSQENRVINKQLGCMTPWSWASSTKLHFFTAHGSSQSDLSILLTPLPNTHTHTHTHTNRGIG